MLPPPPGGGGGLLRHQLDLPVFAQDFALSLNLPVQSLPPPRSCCNFSHVSSKTAVISQVMHMGGGGGSGGGNTTGGNGGGMQVSSFMCK